MEILSLGQELSGNLKILKLIQPWINLKGTYSIMTWALTPMKMYAWQGLYHDEPSSFWFKYFKLCMRAYTLCFGTFSVCKETEIFLLFKLSTIILVYFQQIEHLRCSFDSRPRWLFNYVARPKQNGSPNATCSNRCSYKSSGMLKTKNVCMLTVYSVKLKGKSG